jgi:two-component system, OmpR family, sensor kinase
MKRRLRSTLAARNQLRMRVLAGAQRLGRLVDDMLCLARLGQQPGQCREPVDVTALVADCAERVRITDPGRRWQVDVADGLEITGDEELLRQAVDNLCANVLVHTPDNATGKIAATASDGRVRIIIIIIIIIVSDDGPGVAVDKLTVPVEQSAPHVKRPRRYTASPTTA